MKRMLVGLLVLAFVQPAWAGGGGEEVAQRIKDLSTDDEAVRMQAIRYLGDLGSAGRSAIPALVRVLIEAKEPALRSRAGRALAQIGRAAVPRLAELLKHEDGVVRLQAAEALARIGPDAREAQPALVLALKDSSASVRGFAADALGEMDADVPASAAALVAVLAEGEPLRSHVSAALVRLGRFAVPALGDGLKAKQGIERYHSARVLGLLGSEAAPAVPQLIDALHDKEPHVRRMVIVALREIGPDAATAAEPLAAFLAGSDASQRSLAGAALARIGPPAVKPLIALLKKDNQTVRMHALYVLRQLEAKAAEAVPALMDLLHDRRPLLRRMSALTLGRIGPAADRAVDALIALGDDSDRKVRLSAALAVVQLRRTDPRALERLKKEMSCYSTGRASPALLAALNPVRQKENEQFLTTFVLAASPDFGIGISTEAVTVVKQLGADAIPSLTGMLNQLAANPGKNVEVPIVQATPTGPRQVGTRTFWFV
ncbi:MAG TPA: HEAT repeat domain-containing protein [Gemmataceae bacterium]|nr:HEAT repeat domain-containing protein [Gemmataceae bacterium]